MSLLIISSYLSIVQAPMLFCQAVRTKRHHEAILREMKSMFLALLEDTKPKTSYIYNIFLWCSHALYKHSRSWL